MKLRQRIKLLQKTALNVRGSKLRPTFMAILRVHESSSRRVVLDRAFFEGLAWPTYQGVMGVLNGRVEANRLKFLRLSLGLRRCVEEIKVLQIGHGVNWREG